jgi:Asp-tRNA(Asn)/Glu-tRNA(Gln) amidotransferase A subunit family amidase
MTDTAQLTAQALSARLETGVLTSGEIVRACLARIKVRDADVCAWTYVDAADALARGCDLDREPRRSPLHGVPIGIKDVILTQDMPTSYNSELYRDYFPKMDAACIKILRAAGAVILGKTDTVEFGATGRKALTRNPWALTRTPGGSSSGSAAAVADFHVPLALGTQTGGSMIRPASYCGVFAIKPTWGLVSNEGAKAFSPTLDTIGWFARSAGDLKLLYDIFDPDTDADEGAEAKLKLPGARIAICRSPSWGQAEAATRKAMTAAAIALRAAGAAISYLTLPEPFHKLAAAQLVIMEGEGRRSFLSEQRLYGERLHINLRGYVLNSKSVSLKDLKDAYDLAARCRADFDRVAGEYDAVLTPSTLGEAPEGLEDTGAMTFNAMWTLLQVPCINIPFFKTAAGLPVGLTLTGPRFSDRRVLAVAAAMEPLCQI